jgi:ribosomal protein S27E
MHTHLPQALYRCRRPAASPLRLCITNHFQDFIDTYHRQYEKMYGYYRFIVEEVVGKYLKCGDPRCGFARIRCPDCANEYILSFSCRARWFCPACHKKKVLLFGEFITQSVAYPIPHRQYVFSIPIMLRVYFKYNRALLSKLCRTAYESLAAYITTTLHKPAGELGVVMAIQTFGEYLNYHPHLHAVVTDGVFTPSGMFYVSPHCDTKSLEELFRNKVIHLLIKEGLLAQELGLKMLQWKNSGFSVYKGSSIHRNDSHSLEHLCQYIIRNTFSEDKMTYNPGSATVLYKSRHNVKTHRNFELFTAADFIAALTQHIPDKSFQLVRYYGWYSNKKRGMRKKQALAARQEDSNHQDAAVTVLDVADYAPQRIPSKKWRELIKKIWEVDPLLCPNCGAEMKIVALIDDEATIEKILRHLRLWEERAPARAPPQQQDQIITYEPFYDDFQLCPEEYSV